MKAPVLLIGSATMVGLGFGIPNDAIFAVGLGLMCLAFATLP